MMKKPTDSLFFPVRGGKGEMAFDLEYHPISGVEDQRVKEKRVKE